MTVRSCWVLTCLCLLQFAAGRAVFAFEYQKDKRYLVTTQIGERVRGEFIEETDEHVFIKNTHSLALLKIDKGHIQYAELLDVVVVPAENLQLQKAARMPDYSPQFAFSADVALPLADTAAFLKTGFFTRADANLVLPFSFLEKSPFEMRIGFSGAYGVFEAQGRTYKGRLTTIPLLAYVRFKYDKTRFFLKPYASAGSGVTLSAMTKNISATGENSSASSTDLALTGAVGAETLVANHVALFLEVSGFALFEGMNGIFMRVNFGTGYRL